MPGRVSNAAASRDESTAEELPVLPVPAQTVVCVEHPCIIKNLDRGIQSFGGEYAINKAFENGSQPDSFEISLRPEDVMARTMASRKVDVNHLLLKVTVPKRTRRKRKRGSNEPFLPAEDSSHGSHSDRDLLPAETVLQSLKDNDGKASVEVVGKIEQTHRFRNLPDFQYASSTNSLMQNLRDSVLSTDLEKIRDFSFDKSRQLADDQDVGPPPFFTLIKQPFNYGYRQNPFTKTVKDASGNIQVVNATAPIKHIRHNIDPDAPDVPSAQPVELAPLETLPPRIHAAVKKLRTMFEERPLMQRRVFVNKFQGRANENELKAAVGYCGYAFTSGPWRDTVIKFGIDPRKDPQYRMYQTVSYQLHDDKKGAVDDPGSYINRIGAKRVTAKKAKVEHSHVFDGTKFYKDGKVWQACDVTDPMLKELLETSELRSEPDMIFSGWYGNGTWSLFRRLMKYKIQTIAAGRKPNDEMCRAIVAMFPVFVDENNVQRTRHDVPDSFLSKTAYKDYPIDSEASGIAAEVRSTAVAAFRYRKKHYLGGRIRGSGDVVMADAGGEGQKEPGVGRSEERNEEESDAALIGLDSEAEEDMESGADGEEEDDEYDDE